MTSLHQDRSNLEAVRLCGEVTTKRLDRSYSGSDRSAGHIRWIDGLRKFGLPYHGWGITYYIGGVLEQIHAEALERFRKTGIRLPCAERERRVSGIGRV